MSESIEQCNSNIFEVNGDGHAISLRSQYFVSSDGPT